MYLNNINIRNVEYIFNQFIRVEIITVHDDSIFIHVGLANVAHILSILGQGLFRSIHILAAFSDLYFISLMKRSPHFQATMPRLP